MDGEIEAREDAPAVGQSPATEIRVQHFREILLWPIYLIPPDEHADIPDYAAYLLDAVGKDGPWHELCDEFTDNPADFQERHYNEFVAFLPAVQRFLYGQSRKDGKGRHFGDTPIRVLRRTDISAVRIQYSRVEAPLVCDLAHVDLYFFFDIDLAVMALEIHADDVSLAAAQEVMFQFGRAYPAYWEEDGRAGNCPLRVEWLDVEGAVLATSDYEDRRKYLDFTAMHRAPCVAAHWEFLLRPLSLYHSDTPGPLRYRQLEYYRMPVMAYLSFADLSQVSEAEFARLAMAQGSGEGDMRRVKRKRHAHFEVQSQSSRFREIRDAQNSGTRYLSSGRTLVVTGAADNDFFTHLDHGTLSRFRHQDFLLFLIAHFHRAALLMFSDRLAEAVGRLDIHVYSTIQAFRLKTREALETFLRFTHRYWFSEVSDETDTAELFALCRRHLGIDRLYADVRQEVQDMSQYLENEAMRRQNDTVVRLTVVTIFGLIGTVVTGFLGMNLFAYSDETPLTKLILFIIVAIPTAFITLYTVRKSRRLSEFLDRVSDDESKFFRGARVLPGEKR